MENKWENFFQKLYISYIKQITITFVIRLHNKCSYFFTVCKYNFWLLFLFVLYRNLLIQVNLSNKAEILV